MKNKAIIVFSIVGVVTLAALIVPALIPCNADKAQCMSKKIEATEVAGCQQEIFECR